jgi:hypothetical protein
VGMIHTKYQRIKKERDIVRNLCVAINLTSSMINYGHLSLQDSVNEIKRLYFYCPYFF